MHYRRQKSRRILRGTLKERTGWALRRLRVPPEAHRGLEDLTLKANDAKLPPKVTVAELQAVHVSCLNLGSGSYEHFLQVY